MTEKEKRPPQAPPPAPLPRREGLGVGKSGVVMGYHPPEKRARAREFRRAMTPTETVLWQQVRANRLGGLPFRRQQVIDGFIADFYCHAAGLVIEIDGAVHETARDYDAARDRILAARGLRILRLTNDAVLHDLPSCLRQILAAAGRYPPPAPPGAGGGAGREWRG